MIKRCRDRVEAIRAIDPGSLVVIDVPLLIETGMYKEFETVIVVYVNEETQIRRVMEREGVKEGDAKKLIGLQMPLDDKLEFADFVINNGGTREETEKQVNELFYSLSRAGQQ
ncbi:dephospho-CoA kinase [Methanophagales archaeon]|nr:MAG: dephospho-CoA kinase [Methanophagales archaeon]